MGLQDPAGLFQLVRLAHAVQLGALSRGERHPGTIIDGQETMKPRFCKSSRLRAFSRQTTREPGTGSFRN